MPIISSDYLIFCWLSFFVGYKYKHAIYEIEEFEKSGYTKLNKNFMIEKRLLFLRQ
jgi:hypothetical protein